MHTDGEGHQAGPLARAGYEPLDAPSAQAAARANARWWSETAAQYLHDYGEFLGPADFCWCPEGLRESDAALLGPLASLRGTRVLEIGAGAAQCSRWLRSRGVEAVATDVAPGMAQAAADLDSATGTQVPFITADARALPFPEASFDAAFTAFGAIPFVPDSHRVHAELARVLRPGGRWVCSVTHPFRWAFPDDPTRAGLTAVRSYFDRTPYSETADDGGQVYAEFHRTVGDHVREVIAAGFDLLDLVEPEWPAENVHVWGGWGPERGAVLPGTLILVSRRRS